MTGVSRTKVDIVERVMNEAGFTKAESFDHVEALLSIIEHTLADGETLNISGFGNFVVNEKKECRGRNPLSGVEITTDARRVLTFKPSMVLLIVTLNDLLFLDYFDHLSTFPQ
jgi:integration host factor subunit alpha